VATGRPIVFDVNDPSTRTHPWEWAASVGDLWRTGKDIRDTCTSFLRILHQQVGLAHFAGSGHWNDPDMLEIGNGGMTVAEERAEFSLWSILSAPLIAGNDVRTMDHVTRQILGNANVIAVDQDAGGHEGTRAATGPGYEVWTKPLADGGLAAAFLNLRTETATVSVPPPSLGLPADGLFAVRNLWTGDESLVTGSLSFSVEGHGTVMVRIRDTRR
jgi:alpha-galactosidase